MASSRDHGQTPGASDGQILGQVETLLAHVMLGTSPGRFLGRVRHPTQTAMLCSWGFPENCRDVLLGCEAQASRR